MDFLNRLFFFLFIFSHIKDFLTVESLHQNLKIVIQYNVFQAFITNSPFWSVIKLSYKYRLIFLVGVRTNSVG